MKRADFEEIACQVFREDPEPWRRWFFSSVVPEGLIYGVSEDDSSRVMATLLLSPYDIIYMNARARVGYISYVATRKEGRGHGYAARLMRKAIRDAYRRGLDFLTLIPAQRHLFFFYDKFDFSTIFYMDEERYTALQPFEGGTGAAIAPEYEYLERLEQHFGCGVVHSREDYRRILDSQAFESGHAEIAARADDGSLAMLFARWDASRPGSVVSVCSLMAESEQAAITALRELRVRVGERPMTVRRPPLSGIKAFLRPFGMGRIVNVEHVLSMLAAAHTSLKMRLRIYDPLISENSAVFSIAAGRCIRWPWREGSFDLDMGVDTLASVLFSSEKIGEIFNIPSRRAYMALMLE